MFDVRAYRTSMTKAKIKDTIKWGRVLIGEKDTD
jgi:hypothetical protein